MRGIYKNKTTGQVIVTSEKLDEEHWDLVKEARGIKKKNTKMKKSRVLKK